MRGCEADALDHAAADLGSLCVGLGELGRHRGGAGERAGEEGEAGAGCSDSEREPGECTKGHAAAGGQIGETVVMVAKDGQAMAMKRSLLMRFDRPAGVRRRGRRLRARMTKRPAQIGQPTSAAMLTQRDCSRGRARPLAGS